MSPFVGATKGCIQGAAGSNAPAISGDYYWESGSGRLTYLGRVPNNKATRCLEGGVKGYFGAP